LRFLAFCDIAGIVNKCMNVEVVDDMSLHIINNLNSEGLEKQVISPLF